ncbi:MAG: phasin family protein [Ahrensia sp.]|nr:phasin family protein [Ahrensia sp.]
MTKKTTTKAETVRDETIIAAEASKMTTKVAESAREIMRRSAATAKERSDSAYDGATQFNSNLESAMNRMVGGYVTVLGGIATATHENVNRALTTVEKLANAQSLTEAVKIQSDYVRENTTANIENIRVAANTTRDVMMDGAAAVRENVAKVWPYGKAA